MVYYIVRTTEAEIQLGTAEAASRFQRFFPNP